MLRTAARKFSCSAARSAGTIPKLSISEIEAGSRKAIEISKAQGVAQRGLVDGEHFDTRIETRSYNTQQSAKRRSSG